MLGCGLGKDLGLNFAHAFLAKWCGVPPPSEQGLLCFAVDALSCRSCKANFVMVAIVFESRSATRPGLLLCTLLRWGGGQCYM
jgi:hypothetical protein